MKLIKEELTKLISQLDRLYGDALALEKKFRSTIRCLDPGFRKSARNLLHYLALRQHDIRTLQQSLSQLGLSSLGRAEGHVLASILAVRKQLCRLVDCPAISHKPVVPFFENRTLLDRHTKALLGKPSKNRTTRIIVTFSSDLASEYELVVRLLKAGMNCARINCAHDDPPTWSGMIRNLRKAEKETGIPCKIMIDLMGPRLRTGALKKGPQVKAIYPERDELGQIAAPALVWLAAPSVPAPVTANASLPLPAEWVAQLQEGDKINFTDTRNRKRTLVVFRKEKEGVVAHLLKTAYIATGTTFELASETATYPSAEVADLPASEIPILIKKDDTLLLHRDLIPGEPARFDANGHVLQPAHISCTLPEIFDQVNSGDPILFDDGAIEGIIKEVKENELLVKITFAKDTGSKLRGDKGINLPDSKLRLNELTKKDIEDLEVVARDVDIVNLSFANDVHMVQALHGHLDRLNFKHLAVMLKIETKESFKNLPHLLLAAMARYPTGIMIARGDLAVECGWQRLAEVQEEILWLCEAAHIPVVWATQVLETLAKKGRPSRAEITDAAMAQRADCVMLNKGPHIIEAIEMLNGILGRMQEHQHKKTSMLRNLHVSDIGND